MEYKIDINLYGKEILEEAINDYSDYFDISLNDYKLQINGDEGLDTDEVFNEFMNYVIGLINQ